MLLFKTYNRMELEEIFATNRIDVIKRKLDSDGYVYKASGRGKDLKISIKDCKKPFEVFCKEKLGFPPQTDFYKLKVFLKLLLLDEEFAKLPFSTMERETGISSYTISNWIDKLVAANYITFSIGEYIYYVSRRVGYDEFEIEYITEQQYKDAWAAYWEGREDGYFLSVNRLYNVLEGTPHKRSVMVENVFEMEHIEKLKDLLRRD